MFNLSPSQQFMLARGMQQAGGAMPQGMPPMLQRPQGQPVSPQTMPAQPPMPQGANVPGIMNRFRSMVANRLPPQMQGRAANNMMPPQQYQ